MKIIKIKENHYVVVDDSEIKEGDYFYSIRNLTEKAIINYPSGEHIGKITHSTQPLASMKELMEKGYDNILPLDIDEIKELIGEVDVEKKYTEKELIWAIQEAYGHGQDDEFDGVNKIEESIKAITKHLQSKTEWEVEWETIDNRQPCDCSCHNNPNMVHFVACCNDGWIGTVTQKLKLK